MEISIIVLQSLDGFIARSHSDNLSWATRADRDFFIAKTTEIGNIIMGSTTFNNMKGIKGTAFKDRNVVVMTSKPEDYAGYKNEFVKSIQFLSGDTNTIVKHLELQGVKRVAVVGGGKVFYQFLNSCIVDDLYVTVSPHIFGTGIPLCDGELINLKMDLIDVRNISQNEIVLHYKITH